MDSHTVAPFTSTLTQEQRDEIKCIFVEVLDEYLCHQGDMDRRAHREHHVALTKLLKILDKVDTIKWDILRTFIKVLLLTIISLVGYGIYHRIETIPHP